MHYSNPYEYIKQKVDVRMTRNVIEVFFNNHRICSHPRLHGHPGQYSTNEEHMPENHKKYTQWNANRFLSWAQKTYLACAFGIAACRNFYPVKYIRLPDLLNELAVARGEGIYQKVMKQYKKVPLLVLDEWLLVSLKESEARDLLEIVEARHQRGSTIFCSQFTPAGWHGKIGESTLADAILDRIVYNSYTITIEGIDSMRKRKGISN